MTEIYRFRSVERLIEAPFAELEEQTIFLAAPEDLNDPMEGFRDVVWTGDRVVWLNLFKDYINCLCWNFQHSLVFADQIRLEPGHVRSVWPWNELPTQRATDLFQKVWTRVRDQANLSELAETVANTGRQVRQAELTSYLRLIHVHALEAIRQAYVETGILPADAWPQTHSPSSLPVSLADVAKSLREIASEDALDSIFSGIDAIMANSALIYKYNNRAQGTSFTHQNKVYLSFNFPTVYVEHLSQLLWPNWYAACFTKSFHNSSMWGHYGDQHQGACLIFKAEQLGAEIGLPLDHITGRSSDGQGNTRPTRSTNTVPFHQVDYKPKPNVVDFFRSIGKLTTKSLLELWYTDDDGNISDCSQHLYTMSEENNWRTRHWQTFHRDIAIKTSDWAYEQECRLVLTTVLDESLDQQARTCNYEFGSLQGIIFGIRMPDEDKYKIIEVIERKCREHNRTDFRFCQAYYSPQPGEIHCRELKIAFAGVGDDTEENPG